MKQGEIIVQGKKKYVVWIPKELPENTSEYYQLRPVKK